MLAMTRSHGESIRRRYPEFGEIPNHGNDNHKKISDLMDTGNKARGARQVTIPSCGSGLRRGFCHPAPG